MSIAPKTESEISLAEMMQRGVVDVYGWVSEEFGDLTFQMTRVVFDDGTAVGCEGEHDHPYVTPSGTDEELYSRRLAELDPWAADREDTG